MAELRRRLEAALCLLDKQEAMVYDHGRTMLSYPIKLEQDDDTILATSPDFPELTTFGSDRDDALAHAVGALEEAIAARIHWNEDIPAPSGGGTRVTLPALTAAQVERYRNIRNQAVTTARRNR